MSFSVGLFTVQRVGPSGRCEPYSTPSAPSIMRWSQRTGSQDSLLSTSCTHAEWPQPCFNIFLNNMALFVNKSGDHQEEAKHEFLTRPRRSITRITTMFLRSLTAAALQPRAPAATYDSVSDSGLLQGLPTVHNDVPTAPRQEQAAGTSKSVVIAPWEGEVDETVDMIAIKCVPSTHNLRTGRRQFDVSYNKE